MLGPSLYVLSSFLAGLVGGGLFAFLLFLPVLVKKQAFRGLGKEINV